MRARKFIDRLTANWPAKVLSVGAAVLLFLFNRMSALEERFFSVPLKVAVDGDLVPSSPYPRMIRVTLRGEADSIYPILESDIEAYIDLSSFKSEGVYKIPVMVRKQGTALDVDPLEVKVDPIEIALALEKRTTKIVPVTPSFRGYLENGYELSSYSLEPAQVEISGPRSAVDRIHDVTTDFIELSGRRESFSAEVKILNRDTLVIVRGDGSVAFRGTVDQSVLLRTFEKLPIVLSGLPAGFVGRPDTNFGSVRLQGSQKDLELYQPEASLLTVDCSGITKEGAYVLPLIVSAPPNFQVIRYDPLEVTVQVLKENLVQEGEGR